MIAEPDELQVDDTEPTDDEEPQNFRFEITSFPTDFTVKVMAQKWLDGQLIIPDFQRRYVWNLPQASRLIESFLLGLPIPQVFLYRERSSPKLLVVDGQQRLATIAKFYTGEFSENRTFRLRGVSSQWDGKSYRDLNEDDKLVLDDSPLRSIVVQQTRPDDNSSIYQIFERLNTGGTSLNAMEIRKAVFHGSAYDLLETLNEDPDWRAIIGMSAPDRRLKDVELILRVLALAGRWHEYVKPMKKFITDYMDWLSREPQSTRNELATAFVRACHIAHGQLDGKPFHLRQRLNIAALDSVMACVLQHPEVEGALPERFTELKGNERFQNTVARDTSDASVVMERFKIVESTLRP